MRWVDVTSYVGLDRRRRGGFRLFDRRGDEIGGPPPSLPTALRQLRLRCMGAASPDGLRDLRERACATADLAEAFAYDALAQQLRQLAEVAGRPGPTRSVIEQVQRSMLEIEALDHGALRR